jgi:hypothetical protein
LKEGPREGKEKKRGLREEIWQRTGWEKTKQGMGWGELYRLSISGELNRQRRSAVGLATLIRLQNTTCLQKR